MTMEEGNASVRRSGRVRTTVSQAIPDVKPEEAHQESSRKRPASTEKGATKKKKLKKAPTATATRKNPKRKSAPQFLKDSEGNMVWLAAANLQDITRAERTKKHPFGGGKKRHYLHTVSSPAQRQAVYDRASKALADIETCLLPSYGGRPWKVFVTVSDPIVGVSQKKRTVSPYFVFTKKGVLELAAWPHILLKIPAPPKFPGYYSSAQSKQKAKQKTKQPQTTTGASAESDEEEECLDRKQEVVDEEWEMIYDLQERDVTPLSELAFQERSRVPLPIITTKWISPMRESFSSRKSAWDHAVLLCKQDAMLEKALKGYDPLRGKSLPLTTAPITAKKAWEVGAIRFKRDGLWVIGQEESWKEERDEDEEDSAVPAAHPAGPRELSGMQYYVKYHRYELHAKRRKELNQTDSKAPPRTFKFDNHQELEEPPAQPKTFTLKEADNELRHEWKTLTNEEKEGWKEIARQKFHDEQRANEKTTKRAAKKASVPVTPDGKNISRQYAVEGLTSSSFQKKSGRVTPSSGEDESVSHAPSRPLTKKKQGAGKLAPFKKWCLTADQVKKCYDAGMEHFDTVIATVKARGLHRELQDGFDVFRERCRGRYDMELPVFDTPAFSFLTSDKAPWMPVVRQVLGHDVVLIHKGMFLSVPGAEAQPYHQDGLHLTTHTQRDCHAVNVFVPLVDLTIKHGPTEFCLGTHILEQEEYDPEFCETPLAQAGTPILFDYRLGHKGLANTSGSCRPIVYCTYSKAAGGKEFRDKVNFSRTRYHRIGDMVSRQDILSREQRAEKRQRMSMENQL